MKKFLATVTIALALTATSACTSQPTQDVATSPISLGQVEGVAEYRDSLQDFNAPSDLVSQFDALMSHDIEGVEGTNYQTVGQTEGLESWLSDLADYTEYPLTLERDLFACYVDYQGADVDQCFGDRYESYEATGI